MKTRATCLFLLALGMLIEMFPGRAAGAEQLRVDLVPQGPRARNSSPIPIEAHLKWDSTRVIEGRLEMEFHEGNRVLGRYRTGEMALGGGEQQFHMLLPAPETPYSDSEVEVQIKFVTTKEVIAVEPSALYLPTSAERSLVVGFCDVPFGGGANSWGIERHLALERFAPESDVASQKTLLTSVVRLTPDELPAQPLGYTAYDVVVLTADAFKSASERQLGGLARWVRGGGSVCVQVGEGVEARHVQFLNELAGDTPDGPAYMADAGGRLLPARNGLAYLRSELGRSVIVTAQNGTNSDLDEAVWRKASAFLWKVHKNQVDSIASEGHWEEPSVQMPNNSFFDPRLPRPGQQPPMPRFTLSTGRTATQHLAFTEQPSILGAELMSRLMPRTVRLIPFPALMGMLTLFVLMIGPADYFFLGMLRKRKLTWVLFPATSLAVMAATVLMANYYLGLRDQRRSLVVVDLAKDGSALRWNRYQLVFAARDKQAVTELKDALWSPLNVGDVPVGMGYQTVTYYPGGNSGPRTIRVGRPAYPGNGMNGAYGFEMDSGRDSGPPLYDGVLPVHFQTSEAIRQWQPVLNRTFSFEPPPVSLLSNWHAIEECWPDMDKVRAKLQEDKNFKGNVYAISSHDSVEGDPSDPPEEFVGVVDQRPAGTIVSPWTLRHLSAADTGGNHGLVSQISPTGGGNFEDVQVLDPTTRDSVLVIVTEVGDDIVVYRRLFAYGN